MPPSYVRVKRRSQVIFVECDLEVGETVVDVKNRIEEMVGVRVRDQRLLMEDKGEVPMEERDGRGGQGMGGIGSSSSGMQTAVRRRVMDEGLPLADQGVENDAVLYLVLQREDGSWEEVDVPDFVD